MRNTISILIVMFLLIFVFVSSSFSAITKYFKDKSLQDFEKGELNYISLNKDGFLSLSPKTVEVLNKNNLVIWDVEVDSKGDVYVGTGNPGVIYKITADKKIETIYDANTLGINCLTVDKDGNVYAVITPENQLIKIDKEKEVSKVCSFDESYIWDMELVDNEKLYVVTGNPAKFYSVNVTGEKNVLYSSTDESHFFCLAIGNDKKNCYFGSEGKGILYRWNIEKKKAKVLYDSYEDEIRDILITNKGAVVFATSTKIPKEPPDQDAYIDTFKLYGSSKERDIVIVTSEEESTEKSNDETKKRQPLKNSVYKIEGENNVVKLLTKDDTAFLSLTEDAEGNLYCGSGDEGLIYKIMGVNNSSIFLDMGESQILKLSKIDNNKFYFGTGNLGKVYQISFKGQHKGEYLSQVYDAGGKSKWGNIIWEDENSSPDKLKFFTRSGNTEDPDKTWSEWKGPYVNSKGEQIKSSEARYIQYKVMFEANDLNDSPIVKTVTLSYLLYNRVPVVENVELKEIDFDPLKQLTEKPKETNTIITTRTLSWTADDEDNDILKYKVECKHKDGKRWMLLAQELDKTEYVFDTRRLSDGQYKFRITASDITSNSVDQAEQGINSSKLYKIDNTSPVFTDFKFDNQNVILKFTAEDSLSLVKYCLISINSSEWIYISPKDLIYDSTSEEFKVELLKFVKQIRKGDNSISVLVLDEVGNYGTKSMSFQLE